MYPSAESNQNTSSYKHDSGSCALRLKKEEIISHIAGSLCYAKVCKITATETKYALEIVKKQQGWWRGVTSIICLLTNGMLMEIGIRYTCIPNEYLSIVPWENIQKNLWGKTT